jgi:predicted N-acetyltransferase YhbS
MTERIRTTHVEEFPEVMRLIERAFGARKGFFERYLPHHFYPDPQACAQLHVLERDGRIVAHVAVLPIEITTRGLSLKVGGISSVATHPEHQGQGYMSRLLRHVIQVMKAEDYPLSGLGGDRQRYGLFGWDHAGETFRLYFSKRSLQRAGIEPLEVVEVYPWEALEMIQRLRPTLACTARQPRMEKLLHKVGLRAWLAEDGYALASYLGGEPISIVELASESGREAGLIHGILDWCSKQEASWRVSRWDKRRIARIMPAVLNWPSGYDWTYRIIDLYSLLSQARETLESRSAGMCDWETTLVLQEHGDTQAATIALHAGKIQLEQGEHCRTKIELDPQQAARLLLGGPASAAAASIPPGLRAVLPIPVHVPAVERV